MVSGARCAPEDPRGWEGYQSLPEGALQRCRYSVTSCVGVSGEQKRICEAQAFSSDSNVLVTAKALALHRSGAF